MLLLHAPAQVAVSTSALASYDQIKEALLKSGALPPLRAAGSAACTTAHLSIQLHACARLHICLQSYLLRPAGLVQDGVPCHLASSLCAGFFSTVCGSPFDVVKSRMMGGRRAGASMPLLSLSHHCTIQSVACRTLSSVHTVVTASSNAGAPPGMYQGVLDAFLQTLRREGPLALYNGFTTQYARLGELAWRHSGFCTDLGCSCHSPLGPRSCVQAPGTW